MKLTGKVTDAKNKQGIPAVVFKSDQTGKSLGVGAQANIEGFYSIDNIEIGDFITASLIGSNPVTKKVTNLSPLNFELLESTNTLNTFEVVADKVNPVLTKQSWFDKNKKWVIIGGASMAFLIFSIVIIKSIKSK